MLKTGGRNLIKKRTMEKKCKNCGKLERNHYKGPVDERGGVWCHKISKVKPGDENYWMSYEEDSP